METKKYASYAEIDHDLKILKVEREIHLEKIKLCFEKTKESVLPSNVFSFIGNTVESIFSGFTGTIVKTLIPIVVSWFVNKKRGD